MAQVATAAPLLEYKDFVAETRRIERLEGGEYTISQHLLFHQTRLNLKPVGRGSDAMFVRRADEIGFVCEPALKDFRGGWLDARVEKHEPGGDSGHFYTLSNCQPSK